MAHLLRVWADTALKVGLLPSGVDLKTLDQNTFVTINADLGGTWTPAGNLTIGGAGLIVAAPSTVGGTTGFGITSTIDTNGGSAQIVFGQGSTTDVFGYPSPQTYTLTSVFCEHFSLYHEQADFLLNYNASASGVRTLATGARFHTPLGIFNGATLTQVQVNWTVNEAHANIPATLPAMRVVAVDVNGTVLPLRALDLPSATDPNGFQPISTAATASAYNASNANQVWTYTCNQNNVIDISRYSYSVEIIDESGANAWMTTGNTYSSAVGTYTNVLGYDGRN